ncbi:MAG: arsenate reductase ArsC [Nitrospiria bacterium]
MKPKKTVLFVCIENACRSQMAEAFARMLGSDVIDPYSGGSQPSGKVNEKAMASMRKIGCDLRLQTSKGLDRIPNIEYDLLVTLGCGDACPTVPAKYREDWAIPDPKKMPMKQFDEVRDLIRHKVASLVADLRPRLQI